MHPALYVIIPAAGSGSRMAANGKSSANPNSALAKQYLTLAGKPVLHYSLQLFCQHPQVNAVYLALSPDDQTWQSSAWQKQMGAVLQHPHCHLLASGGASRAATVLNTLQQIEARDDDWIVVHDAARPGLTTAMFERLLKALQDHPVGGLLALPVADTVKLADAQQQVQATQAREGLWTAQTPQMFRYHVLLKALQQADIAPTDEAQAVEALGLKPQLVAGSLRNMKITYPPDLALVEAMMQIKDDE